MQPVRWVRLWFVAILLLPCAGHKPIVAAEDAGWLVSPELLRHANLKVVWRNQLPMQKTETLDRLMIVENRIYALSSRNFMVSMDRHQGSIIFARVIAPPGFVVMGLELYENELVSTIGNELVELDPNTGREIRYMRPEFGIVCPPARNSSYFYVSGTDKRLHVLQADNRVQVFEVAAENEPLITSIIADEDFVVFGTNAGNVISITANRPNKLWQFNATKAIAGPIVRDETSFFFASEDTHVYRVDMGDLFTSRMIWKTQLPGILHTAPRVTESTVYQYTRGKGLIAIDKRTGELIWSVEQGWDLLAESAGRAYVMTNMRILVVMDNQRAKRLYSVNFTEVARHAANTIDSKIYVADQTGYVACLEPTGR